MLTAAGDHITSALPGAGEANSYCALSLPQPWTTLRMLAPSAF